MLNDNNIIVGCPRIVRSDRGTDNSKVAFLQPFLRRNNPDQLAGEHSFQYGRFASNQTSQNIHYIML